MRAIRGLSRLASGELLLFGETDFCVALTPRGTAKRIALPDRGSFDGSPAMILFGWPSIGSP